MFQEIIKGIETHDKRIQETIYSFYWGYLMGVASRYIKDRSVAMEVVNDSFVKSFKRMYDFNPPADTDEFEKTFRAWLAKITVRTALDKIRINKSPLNFVESYDNMDVDYVESNNQLHVEDIMKLLFQLPDLHRTVFNMYEVEGFSHEEISKILVIPTSSSRTYLTRAKQRLRQLYLKMNELADGNSR
ncbi:RNA polymerase sigma factor [Pedobacter sp.]|uniref:RNA polymerase sigma factor n=1 Tax=Pedobacter sp. TaxID=1411316 RepID=UPI003D7F441D